jgi:hypothetical protein
MDGVLLRRVLILLHEDGRLLAKWADMTRPLHEARE